MKLKNWSNDRNCSLEMWYSVGLPMAKTEPREISNFCPSKSSWISSDESSKSVFAITKGVISIRSLSFSAESWKFLRHQMMKSFTKKVEGHSILKWNFAFFRFMRLKLRHDPTSYSMFKYLESDASILPLMSGSNVLLGNQEAWSHHPPRRCAELDIQRFFAIQTSFNLNLCACSLIRQYISIKCEVDPG